MRLPTRDLIASGLVAVAGLLYALWSADAAPPGMSGSRATGVVILALGFVASASAVVPGFDRLLHGNKVYLVVTALLGVVALAAGISMLAGSETGLGLLVMAMLVLWLISTIHHSLGARTEARVHEPPRTMAQFRH